MSSTKSVKSAPSVQHVASVEELVESIRALANLEDLLILVGTFEPEVRLLNTMRRIGTTSNGNYIVEVEPDEWRRYLSRSNVLVSSITFELKDYRKKIGLTQQQLASKAGISRNYISQIERGQATNISLDVYQRLLEIITDEVQIE